MNVTVKVVVFKNTNRPHRKFYCSYCPELRYFFGTGDTIEEVLEMIKAKSLLWELGYRILSNNLQRRGWIISENSIIPPKFTNDEAVELTKKLYKLSQLEYLKIIELNVEAPTPRTKWRKLSD